MEKINQPLIREKVFSQLKSKILKNEIKSGDKLNEKDLARALGVSRTPIREALHRLEAEGLVEISPRRYCLVKGISMESIHEIHLIRAQLEPIVTYYSVDNITDEQIIKLSQILDESELHAKNKNVDGLMKTNQQFHDIINHASDMHRMIAIINNMNDYIESFRYAFMSKPELVERSIKEHRGILGAIKKRDKDEVKRLVKEHTMGITEYEKVILD